MSEFKFTPGPWKVAANIPTLVIPVEGWRSICTTGNWTESKNMTQCEEENEANAKLITASPDLYKELTNLVNQWHKGYIGAMDIENAEAALKKAVKS